MAKLNKDVMENTVTKSKHKGRVLGSKNTQNQFDKLDDLEAAAARKSMSEKRQKHQQDIRKEKERLAGKEVEKLSSATFGKVYINTEADGRLYSKNKIQAIMENIPAYRESLGYYPKPFPKVPKAKKVAKNSKMILSTPALIEADALGILTLANFNEIKVGGLPALEKFKVTPIGVAKCYEAIETSLEPITYVIDREDYDRNYQATLNSKMAKFRIEKKIGSFDYDMNEYENTVNPSLLSIIA